LLSCASSRSRASSHRHSLLYRPATLYVRICVSQCISDRTDALASEQLQIQGLFLVFVSLFATHPALQKVPRSQHRPHHHSRYPNSLFARLSFFALVLALAHKVAQFSSHCPTSSHLLPSPTSSSHILASTKSLTGVIVVGEQQVPGPNGEDGYRFRYLRADHSLLGGLWTGVSEMELKRMRSMVTEEEVVKRAESIYVC